MNRFKKLKHGFKNAMFWQTPEQLITLYQIERSIKRITPKLKRSTKKLAFSMLWDQEEGKFLEKLSFVCTKTKKCFSVDKNLNATDNEIEDFHFVRWVTYKDL